MLSQRSEKRRRAHKTQQRRQQRERASLARSQQAENGPPQSSGSPGLSQPAGEAHPRPLPCAPPPATSVPSPCMQRLPWERSERSERSEQSPRPGSLPVSGASGASSAHGQGAWAYSPSLPSPATPSLFAAVQPGERSERSERSEQSPSPWLPACERSERFLTRPATAASSLCCAPTLRRSGCRIGTPRTTWRSRACASA